MCAALTGGSHQVPKAGRASTESRGTHLHRFVVVTTPRCCEEQRSLPLFSRVVSSYHEKGNHQKKKNKIKEYKRKKKRNKIPYSLTKQHSGSLVYAQPTNHNQSLMETWGHSSCMKENCYVRQEELNSAVQRGKQPYFLSQFSQTMLPPINLKVGAEE